VSTTDQNARFFDSNTLYKKELKQKQREIITSPTTSLSFANAISTTITNDDKLSNKNAVERCETNQKNIYTASLKNQHSLKEEIEESDDKAIIKEIPSHTSVSTSNKMLNLFSSFLNRHNSKTLLNQNLSFSNSSNTAMNNPSSNSGNYLNIKNLKRATSSNNFGVGPKIKVNSNSAANETTNSVNKTLFNPVALFSNSNNSNKNKTSELLQSKVQNTANLSSNFSFMKTNNKHRRSYDDVSKLSIQVTDSNPHEQSQVLNKQNNFISPETSSKMFKNKNTSKNQANPNLETNLITNLNSTEAENIFIDLSNNSKFENTAFSTKNNGLIFLPSPTKIQSSLENFQKQNKPQNDNYEPDGIDNLKESYDNLSIIDPQLESM